MDIVILSGGLGNQMSQYAFAIAKSQMNNVIISSYLLRREKSHNGYELYQVFGISNKNKILIDLISRLARKVVYLKNNKYFKYPIAAFIKLSVFLNFKIIEEKRDYSFDSDLLKHNIGLNIYWGGWSSEKYYSSVESQIRKLYCFNVKALSPLSSNLKEKIDKCNSISLHVRRGDYINNSNMETFGKVCCVDYYLRAIAHMNKVIDNPIYVIFSDDIEWVKQNLPLEGALFVDWNTGNNSWQDMCLMSFCKHNINANSTFSWWGAWLNNNPNKTVITPKFFINNLNTPDFYPSAWLKL